MAYLLGIDGGGSHTAAWLADENLRVLAKAEAGPSNPIKVGVTAAQGEILRAVRRTCAQAKIRTTQLDVVCAGIAGAGLAPSHDKLLRGLRRELPGCALLLKTDAAITLAAALGDAAGIVVIAGTGSIAYGRNEQGHILRAGGWGSLFDDAGSGYDIGRKAVAGALHAMDGREKPTRLAAAICRVLGLKDLTEIVSKPLGPQELAALFPTVLGQARAGDQFARRLCQEGGSNLAGLALAIVGRAGWKSREIPVFCSGGVFGASQRIRRSFARHLHQSAPRARVSLLRRKPVEGALRLARQLLAS
jgi:N-acetylglucosamine kinase-like BadF-type ATPase